MGQFAIRIQNIDRRILYFCLLGIIVVGLLVPIPLPLAIGPQARGAFESIENAPTDKVAIVSTNWSASTQGENKPQTTVVLEHMMRRKIPIAFVSFEPSSTELAQELMEDISKKHGYEYGKDWINLGFRADIQGTLKAMMIDIHETFKKDSRQEKALAEFPIMRKLKNLRDAGVIAEISPSGTYKYWVGLVVGSVEAPFIYGPTSVMAPELYTYLDSGQMDGMMFGIKGAAEYEQLLGIKGFTTKAITPVSLALVMLFILIGLGNWGMFAARRAAEAGE